MDSMALQFNMSHLICSNRKGKKMNTNINKVHMECLSHISGTGKMTACDDVICHSDAWILKVNVWKSQLSAWATIFTPTKPIWSTACINILIGKNLD